MSRQSLISTMMSAAGGCSRMTSRANALSARSCPSGAWPQSKELGFPRACAESVARGIFFRVLSNDDSKRILVLGIGNILWADEGFGVRCVEALNAGWSVPPQVDRLMDGGTQGLYLLPYVQEADCLLVFDAVDYGRSNPARCAKWCGDQVPRFMGVKKMSLHQTGFQEVLMAAATDAASYPSNTSR
jgi:hydrogenase expression/formation protein